MSKTPARQARVIALGVEELMGAIIIPSPVDAQE
jgi:hypothetical protein